MARQRVFELHAGEIDDFAVGFTSRLGSETLSGTPEVTVHEKTGAEGTYAGVTVSGAAVNAAETDEDSDGDTHAIGKAVEFRLTADDDAVAGTYTLRVECGTTGSRSLVATFDLVLRGPPEA